MLIVLNKKHSTTITADVDEEHSDNHLHREKKMKGAFVPTFTNEAYLCKMTFVCLFAHFVPNVGFQTVQKHLVTNFPSYASIVLFWENNSLWSFLWILIFLRKMKLILACVIFSEAINKTLAFCIMNGYDGRDTWNIRVQSLVCSFSPNI